MESNEQPAPASRPKDQTATQTITHSDAELDAWSTLADDAQLVLERIAQHCLDLPVGTGIWSTKGVAARIMLRAYEFYGSTRSLIGSGARAAPRALARGLLECAFGAAALTAQPDELIVMLKDDSEESRRRQGQFILGENLATDDSKRSALKHAIDAIESKLNIISPKKVAKLGPIFKQYLQYQRLSDDSSHLTARSLEHYVNREADGWSMTSGAASPEDSVATLQVALQSALLTGLAVCELMEFENGPSEIADLLVRLSEMPPTKLF